MIKIGGHNLADIKVGEDSYGKAYWNNSIIWQKAAPVGDHYIMNGNYDGNKGNAYINTGVYANLDTKVYLKFSIPCADGDIIMGSKENYENTPNFFRIFAAQPGVTPNFYFDVKSDSIYPYSRTICTDEIVFDEPYEITYSIALDTPDNLDGGVMEMISPVQKTVRPRSYEAFQSRPVLNPHFPLYIFAGANMYYNILYASKGIKIWECKIWDGDTLIRDFVPNNKDNIPHFLDTVNNVHYYDENDSGELIYV